MGIYDYISDPSLVSQALLNALSGTLAPWAMTLVMGLVGIVALLVLFLLPFLLLVMWTERKLIGRFQVRYGPNRAGPVGLLQPIADAIKVLAKEAITPDLADRTVYLLAPIVGFVPAVLVFAVLPLGPNLVFADLNIGILYVFAVGSVSALTMFMAGWSSNNKYALLGAMRSIAQMVSYEIPMVLSLLGIILLVGSLKMSDIVNYQINNLWLILLQPLAFITYFIAASAELNRTPTDIMEGESEIVAGYHIEYSGFKFTLFYIAEYTNVLAVSAILSTLFFGGWGTGPVLNLIPAWVWFIVKIYFFFCVFVWIRATLPRLRIDQLMGLAWKFLLPMALFNILLTSLEVLLELPLWAMVVVNFVLAGGFIVLWSEIFGPKGVVSREVEAVSAS